MVAPVPRLGATRVESQSDHIELEGVALRTSSISRETRSAPKVIQLGEVLQTESRNVMSISPRFRVLIPAVGFMIFWIPMILLSLRLVISREPGVGLVTILFSLPLILQTLGLALPHNRSLFAGYFLFSLFSSGPYLACLTIYLFVEDPGLFAAPLCIVGSVGLVVLAAFITGIFSRSTSILRRIGRLGGSRGGDVLLALALFISVAYLLAFAFAFDDRHRLSSNILPGLLRTPSVADEESMSIAGPKKLGSVFFDLGSANLIAGGLDAEDNRANLQRILQELKNYRPRQSARITLRGYATGLPIVGGAYGSNYDLATARIVSVQNFVAGELNNDLDIDWVLVPSIVEGRREGRQERRVDVELQEIARSKGVRSLTLLEYIYFTTYTITTTGYGDIMPRSPLAMFICTLANWFEVFFVVVFFNAVLSPRERDVDETAGYGGPRGLSL
jgi:hypothetical protein